MARKITKSKLDSLINPVVKTSTHTSPTIKKSLKINAPASLQALSTEAGDSHYGSGEERPGWYSEPEAHGIEKKPRRFRNPFKRKTKQPELPPMQSGGTDILDIIAPSSVDLSNRDYITIDGMYFAYLYLTGYGYSTTVGNGWLNPLVEAGEGINLIFTINRQPKDKTLSKISQATMLNRSRMRDVGDTRTDYEELDSAINAGRYLKDGMNRYNEDFYYMHTIIEVSAEDTDLLEQRIAAVQNLCVAQDMFCKRADYKHGESFLSALPLAVLGIVCLISLLRWLARHFPGRGWAIAFTALLGLALALPALLEMLPPALIPTRFSDFAFWGRLASDIWGDFKEWLLLRPAHIDLRAKLLLIAQTGIFVIQSILSVILIRHSQLGKRGELHGQYLNTERGQDISR
jgi:hypothetical protein